VNGDAFGGMRADIEIVLHLNSHLNLFGLHERVTGVVLPDGLMSVPSGAFQGTTRLRSIYIPDSVTEIGENAFCNSGLENLTISSNIHYISESAFFRANSNLLITWHFNPQLDSTGFLRFVERVFVPHETTEILPFAFAGATRLRAIYIPNTVNFIGAFAFYGTTNLEEVTIPSSVTNIGISAFANSGVQVVNFITGAWKSFLSDSVFERAKNLVAVNNISERMERIGSRAFSQTYSLESITINERVWVIGYRAFQYSGIRSIYFADTSNLMIMDRRLETIGDFAFANTSLSNIIIPQSVTRIGAGAFYGWSPNQTIFISGREYAPGGFWTYEWDELWSGDATVVFWPNIDRPIVGSPVPPNHTRVHFYNSHGWTNPAAHAWRRNLFGTYDYLLGSWGSPQQTMTRNLGSNWWFVDVMIWQGGGFNIIIYCRENGSVKRTGQHWIQIGSEKFIVSVQPHVSLLHLSFDIHTTTRVYFYNSNPKLWLQPRAHAWNYHNYRITGSFNSPAQNMTQVEGTNFWFIDIPMNAETSPFMLMLHIGRCSCCGGKYDYQNRIYSWFIENTMLLHIWGGS